MESRDAIIKIGESEIELRKSERMQSECMVLKTVWLHDKTISFVH